MKERIELSLSKKYVSSWTYIEAIRELLQNAIDSEVDGNTIEIDYYSKKLTIRSIGSHLEKSTLLLGESGKNNNKYIGKNGEGYKLAVLVLEREEKNVSIYTNGELWKPNFEHSETFDEELLTINITKSDEYDNEVVVFEINNIEQSEMAKLRDNFIALDRYLGREIGATRESEYGLVLLNSEYKGKFYVNGLFVQKDTEFKYGYDFKNEYVNLDRDRKAINHYELKELTAKALTNCGDATLLVNGLKENIVDLRDSEEVLSEISEEQSINFKKHYFEKYQLEEETFIGTDKMIEISGQEKTKVENEIITKIIFKAEDKEEEFESYKTKIQNKNDKASAINAFNQSVYKKLYIWFKENEKRLTKKSKQQFIDILNNDVPKPSTFNLIKDEIDEVIEIERGNE
jgi:hypothetical protein